MRMSRLSSPSNMMRFHMFSSSPRPRFNSAIENTAIVSSHAVCLASLRQKPRAASQYRLRRYCVLCRSSTACIARLLSSCSSARLELQGRAHGCTGLRGEDYASFRLRFPSFRDSADVQSEFLPRKELRIRLLSISANEIARKQFTPKREL